MVTLKQPLCLLFKKLATRLSTKTAFWEDCRFETVIFFRFFLRSRRRLQKGSVLQGENQEIFRRRELTVLPEIIRNEELIAQHYLGLWAGPASTFVKGALKLSTIQCLFFRPWDKGFFHFPFFKSENQDLKRLSVLHYMQLNVIGATSLKDR